MKTLNCCECGKVVAILAIGSRFSPNMKCLCSVCEKQYMNINNYSPPKKDDEMFSSFGEIFGDLFKNNKRKPY